MRNRLVQLAVSGKLNYSASALRGISRATAELVDDDDDGVVDEDSEVEEVGKEPEIDLVGAANVLDWA